MKKILVVGNGAREHIIAATLKKSPQDILLFAVGKALNPGLSALCEEYLITEVTDGESIAAFGKEHGVDFAVIGPEAPFVAGVVEALEAVGIKSMSPNMVTGQLESSKAFTRNLVDKYKIPGNPMFREFTDEEGLEEFFGKLGEDFVVKADGLKGGKGVKVSGDHLNGIEEGIAYAKECIADSGRVVVEEKLVGQEFSLLSFCDGSFTVEMPAAQDHKRAYDNDEGPNTGGMGTFSDAGGSLPFLRESDIEEAAGITAQVAKAIKEETGQEFKGVMYGGFMAVKEGVKLIEYNARFGDPEVMNVLSLLESDFVEICEAVIEGRLSEVRVSFSQKATVCKYAVPEGYPVSSVKDVKISLGELPEGVSVYYGSVDQREDGLYLCGSRALAFVAVADSIAEAEKLVSQALEGVEGPVFFRKDIATAESIEKKVAHMREVRG